MPTVARWCSLVFTALTLAPSLAHLLALPNKIHLAGDAYLAVQQIYRGWALLGIVILAALASTLAQATLAHDRPEERGFAIAAFLCLAAAQVLFWIYTFPANQLTANWTFLPSNWELLRTRWEYSHAAGALLNLTAFILLALAAVRGPG